MPKNPSLETLLCFACKGDRAAADLATRTLNWQVGRDPVSSHDPALLAWLERRGRRSRRRGGLRAKVLRATGVLAGEQAARLLARDLDRPTTDPLTDALTDPPDQEPHMHRHSSNAVLSLPAVLSHANDPLDFTVFSACSGKRAAIERVARELRPRLVRAVCRASPEYRQDAEDVVQDLFVAMLERRLDPGPHVAGSVDRLIAHLVQQVCR